MSCCQNSENNNECEDFKSMVKEGYSKIANQSKSHNEQTICGIGGTCCVDYSIFSEDYSKQEGYCETADLGLGCGVPTSVIKINKGDTILDLGSGAGNDCFVARSMVGEEGKVIGLDFTPEMLKKAWANTDKLGYKNVEFRFGDIEDMPIMSGIIDKVISNCVINLAPNKNKVFSEIMRVLKPGGIFSISDIVIVGDLTEKLKKATGMYIGCVSGAMNKEDYLTMMTDLGFKVTVLKEKEILIPEKVYLEHIDKEEYESFVKSGSKIVSITVVGQKVNFEKLK
jgi:arsenite methyltransferase